MSFYSYKNANPCSCPGAISGSALDGLQEKVCVQLKRVYDSCLQQEQPHPYRKAVNKAE